MKNRRAFIQNSSVSLALPFLESFGFRAFASTPDRPVSPKRLVFLGMGYGVTQEYWYPDVEKTGLGWELPELLSPLAKHQDGLSLIQNLHHANSRDGHSGSTFWLTGADRFAVRGQSFHNTISVDQVAAGHFGAHTRFNSLQFESDIHQADGHGPGLSLAWNRKGKPVSAFRDPVAAFHHLFSGEKSSVEERQAELLNQRSILDTVLTDVRSVQKGLTKTDVEKVDEYLDSVRTLETRISKEKKWLDIPRQKASGFEKAPAENLSGANAVEVIYDLMVAALQVDATRVLSSRLPGDVLLQSLGATITAHHMSHYANDSRRDISKQRDREHARLLSYLLDKLKATKNPDGSSLFDRTTVVFGSNLSKTHSLHNCPTIVAGGGSGFQQGQHIVAGKDTPLCNLWLSLLQANDVPVEQFGDSTGTIEALRVS